MSETKQLFTRGPWRTNSTATRFELTGGDGFPVLRINGGMLPVEANARLIAAAPELLQQLQFCCEQLRECMEQNHGQTWANANTVVANAEAAIARAEGRTT